MVISFVCLVPVRLLRPNMAVLYHMNGKLQKAYYYRLLSNSRKAFLFSYVSGDLEKLVFPVVSQDNGNLAFCRGQVFSMVCLLPLTARFKLQLGERNAFFCKSQPGYIANWDNLICVGNISSRRPSHHKEMFPFVLTMADISLFVWLDFARNGLKNDKWHSDMLQIWSSQTNISIALQRCMVRKVEPDSTRSCVLDHLRR